MVSTDTELSEAMKQVGAVTGASSSCNVMHDLTARQGSGRTDLRVESGRRDRSGHLRQ